MDKKDEKMKTYLKGTLDYKQMIEEEVHGIEDDIFIMFLYNMIISFKKKWGI